MLEKLRAFYLAHKELSIALAIVAVLAVFVFIWRKMHGAAQSPAASDTSGGVPTPITSPLYSPGDGEHDGSGGSTGGYSAPPGPMPPEPFPPPTSPPPTSPPPAPTCTASKLGRSYTIDSAFAQANGNYQTLRQVFDRYHPSAIDCAIQWNPTAVNRGLDGQLWSGFVVYY